MEGTHTFFLYASNLYPEYIPQLMESRKQSFVYAETNNTSTMATVVRHFDYVKSPPMTQKFAILKTEKPKTNYLTINVSLPSIVYCMHLNRMRHLAQNKQRA